MGLYIIHMRNGTQIYNAHLNILRNADSSKVDVWFQFQYGFQAWTSTSEMEYVA